MSKLQRLLAQQRALEAEIKKLESEERERQEKVLIVLIRKHGLTKFPVQQIDSVLAEVVAKLTAQNKELPWVE